MSLDPNAATVLDDRDLVLLFESIGDNCELGLVQRRAGAEPLGLLRFAGTPLRNLLRGLNARFANIADPNHIRINPEHGEYMVKLTKYDFTYHADVKVGDMEPEALHQQQIRTVGFLAAKLIADLENPSKILVFRQNEPLLGSDLIDLRIALSAYGPSILLWVQEACPGHPPGSVDVADERMMVGYVRRLAERDTVPDLDFGSWMQVLRRAHAISLQARDGRLVRAAAEPPARTELTFGLRRKRRSVSRSRMVRAGGWLSVVDRRAQPTDRRCPWRGGRILAGNGCHAVYQATLAAAAAAGRGDRWNAGT